MNLEIKVRQADAIKADLERCRDELHALGADVAESHVDDAIAFLEEFAEAELRLPAKLPPDGRDTCAAMDPTDAYECSLRRGHRGDHEAWCTEPIEMVKKWARTPRKRKAA